MVVEGLRVVIKSPWRFVCESGDILYLNCPNHDGVLACGVSIALSLSMYLCGT